MFGIRKKRSYLDYAAAMPPTHAAIRAHRDALKAFGNPSSAHEEGREAKRVLEDARTRVARVLSVKADDVLFTSGATEANNIAIQGITVSAHERGVKSPQVLYLSSAHASVVRTIETLFAWGVTGTPLPVRDAAVNVAALEACITPDTVLVAMDMVCGETGIVWNTKEVSRALERRGIPLLVDASQAPLTELMERTRIGASMLVMDAQKIGGVRGTGVLIAPRTISLSPVHSGGGQERGVRPGTENVAGAAAFAQVLEDAQKDREGNARAWQRMRADFIRSIRDIRGLEVNEGKKQSPRIVNVSLGGRDADYLVALLDECGFAVSTKSACEFDSREGSRAVTMLTGDANRAASTLRISWGPGTSSRELMRLAHALHAEVVFLDTSL